MIPITLSLAGFLSYRQPQTLDFTQFELACISGSNGAGKSSLLDAITWVLFGQARKRDESLINAACEKAEVTLDFAYEDQVYRVHRSITRGKGSQVDFFIEKGLKADGASEWKALSERTLRETEALIQRTLRLDYETFTNASFFLQGKADMFAQQKASDRKRILASILGLDVWEEYRKRANLERGKQETELGLIDDRLKTILAELGEEDARRQRLAEVERELKVLTTNRDQQSKLVDEAKKLQASLKGRRDMLATLREQLDSSVQKRDHDLALLGSRQEEMAGYQSLLDRAGEIEQVHGEWQALRKELEALDGVATKFRAYQDRQQEPLRQIAAERARLEQEVSGLESNLATLQANESLLPELESQLEASEAKVDACHQQLAEKSALEDEITRLNQERADARAENPRLKGEMEELRARLDALEKATEPACPVCKQPLSEKDRQAMIKELYDEGNDRKAKYRANEALLKDFDQRMTQKETALNGLRQVDDALRNATRQADQVKDRIGQVKAQRAQWDASEALHLAEVKRLLADEQFLPQARQKLAAIEAEMRDLGYDAAAHAALKQKELSARQVEGEFASLGNAMAAMAPLGRQVSDLEKQLGQHEQDVKRLQEAHDTAAAQLASEMAGLPDLREAEDALFNAQEALNEHNRLLGSARQSVAVLATLKERKKALGEEREAVSRLVEQYKMLERAFGKDGVPALLIEQALPEIEENANITLGRLSDNSMSVRFDTQRAFKDEKREDKKETLDIRISDGSGTRDYEMFSGGEAFRVNFAIRLALSRILAQRAGARLQTLVIDEGFGNQDAQGKQRLIEVINLVKGDFAKVLVITHLEDLKDHFPNRIEVEKTDQGSVVRVS